MTKTIENRHYQALENAPEQPDEPGRRRFLKQSVGVGTGMATLGATTISNVAFGASDDAAEEADDASDLPDVIDWKDEDAMILHGRSPITLETKRYTVGTSGITPATRLYIRNNLPVPDEKIVADRDAWQVSIEGVKNAKSLSVGELKTMGLTSVVMVLQCSGNGRGSFDHTPSGSQWRTGASGNVVWGGVPLKDVIAALGGPADGMKFLTSTGGEELPKGLDEDKIQVERSIPIEKALDDVLLAWEMDGQPIPLVHGGPLRVIVPGYYGCNNIKYVKRVALTPKESAAHMQKFSYRVRPIGVEASPDQPTMWDMNVKSFITGPGAKPGETVRAGHHVIYGVAFGGNEAVKDVDISIDGGQNWQKAELFGADMGRYAWRTFRFEADLPAGKYVLASRATNQSGEVQPQYRLENQRGYANNSWHDHALSIVVKG